MNLVTLASGVCLPAEAIELAVNLEFEGWNLAHEGDTLRVLRREDSDGEPLSETQRELIRKHKPDLLRIVDLSNEIATSDAASGRNGHKARRK